MITGVEDISLNEAFKWAHEYGITTMAANNARLDSPVLRYEFAIMMINYIKNVENKTISHNEKCDITKYRDYWSMSSELRSYIQDICDAGLM